MAKKKKQHHEEHVDETWLLPYSDMMTLLLALFIVMFAMSKVDSSRAKALSSEFNNLISGGKSVMKDSSGNNTTLKPNLSDRTIDALEEQNELLEVKNKIEKDLANQPFSDSIKVEVTPEGLLVSIQDKVIFNSGDAMVLDSFKVELLNIANSIKNVDNEIRISGHTDNVPINNTKFQSNWDLSYYRAANVMDFMVKNGGMSAEKFSVIAYGQYKAKFDNSTEEGRALNRRVEILIVRKYEVEDITKK